MRQHDCCWKNMSGLPYFWEHVKKSIIFHTSRSQRAVAVASILSRSARMMQFGSLALLLSPSELDAKNVSSPSVFVYWSNHWMLFDDPLKKCQNATWTFFHIISPFFSCNHFVASSNFAILSIVLPRIIDFLLKVPVRSLPTESMVSGVRESSAICCKVVIQRSVSSTSLGVSKHPKQFRHGMASATSPPANHKQLINPIHKPFAKVVLWSKPQPIQDCSWPVL